MMNIKNQMKNIFRIASFALLLCVVAGFTSCAEEDDLQNVEYGYVQFKLYKNDTAPAKSATRATLDFLSDAHKVKVYMQHGSSTIEQTLVLNSYNAENAEYGLRSDKLQLLAGDYRVVGYTLYDNLDEEIMTDEASSQFTVVPDGLVYHNLSVDVTPRGKASFRLVKPEAFTATRAGEAGAYPFSNIKVVDISVKNAFGIFMGTAFNL